MIAPVVFAALIQGAAATPPQQAQPARPAAPVPASAPQLGFDVQPDTVTVGEPFRVIVRVRAARGSRITFPAGPDSLAAVELLDPLQVRTTADSSVVAEQTASYRMAAWDVGDQPLRLTEIVVETDGVRRGLPLESRAARVFVRSVLPRDSAQRVPKPARPIFETAPPWWRLALLVAAAVLALLLLVWMLYRRWRRRRQAGNADLDPYAYAEREFARVEALGLVEAGERGRFVALMVEVLRDYLARRLPGAPPSLTSTEVLMAVRGARGVPQDRLTTVLGEADLIKFARRQVSAERARELAREARAIVREVNEAQAQAAAEAAAAASAAGGGQPPQERAA